MRAAVALLTLVLSFSLAHATPSEDLAQARKAFRDGNYQIWVQGWSVSGTPSFLLSIIALQGSDLTVTGPPDGPIPANTPVTLTVEYSKAMVAGDDYVGELLLGPPTAPTAFNVPITIRRG